MYIYKTDNIHLYMYMYMCMNILFTVNPSLHSHYDCRYRTNLALVSSDSSMMPPPLFAVGDAPPLFTVGDAPPPLAVGDAPPLFAVRDLAGALS